jgi:hypothetical protein
MLTLRLVIATLSVSACIVWSGCNGGERTVDVHQLGSCEPHSYADNVNIVPEQCERECMVYVAGSGARCSASDEVAAGEGSDITCDATFVGSDGVTGCCVVGDNGGASVGEFWECD